MNNIDELLKLVPEKFEWRNTTSKKFKKDLYDFFNKDEFKSLSCMEIGCVPGDKFHRPLYSSEGVVCIEL